MLCMLTVRRLKPGTEEAFRQAWTPRHWHERFVRGYHLRSEDDPRQVITLGFFEGSQDDLDAMRDEPAWMAGEERRLQRIAPIEDEVLLSGVWEVVDEFAGPPPSSTRT